MFKKQEFARLLELAKGDRSINEYARECGVSSAHISRLLRCLLDTPPNPETIKKFAQKAANGVTYEDLMKAAGHIINEVEAEEKTIDDEIMEIMEIMRELGPDVTLMFYDLKGMSQEEKESLKIFLQGLLARRKQREENNKK
jgi:transcriptional regulator with XRE-family HTH domain